MAENGSYSSLRGLSVEIKDKPDLFAVIIRAFAELLPFTGQINPLTEEAADTLVVEISGGARTYVVGSAGFKVVILVKLLLALSPALRIVISFLSPL